MSTTMESGEWEDADSDGESVHKASGVERLKRRHDNTKDRSELCKAFDIDMKYDPNQSMEEQHAKVIALFIAKLYEEKNLCDVILKVGKDELPAHKFVLSAHSPKLFKLFVDKHEGTDVELFLNKATIEGVAATLCFIYTHKIVVSIATVDSLLSASKELGFQEIIQMCQRFLLTDRTLTIFEQLDVAQKHNLDDVTKNLNQHINEHFLETVYSLYSMGFLNCSFSQLCELLSRDDIHVISEIDVFYAAFAWLNAKRSERMMHAVDVMKCIRFMLMSPEEIATHVETTHVLKIPEIKAMVYQAVRYHALLNTGSSLASVVKVPHQRKWIPASKKNIQIRDNSVIFGGSSKKPTTNKKDKGQQELSE
ncbi:unnamed protein product [Owenia fusiformis]|uniref:Uncharacterized protein n=1 Tax=Owenia fusiformis TaxID=6347 RepID=A0A8J1UZN6_OWEFU|nr:unnamed protein product [Owenia fusiformis]